MQSNITASDRRLGIRPITPQFSGPERLDLQFRIDSRMEAATVVIEQLSERLSQAPAISHREIVQCCGALHEALSNAIYHGNLELDSGIREDDDDKFLALAEERCQLPPYCDRKVAVRCVLTRETLTITVFDDGPGFNPGGVLDPTIDNNLQRSTGRGLLLIQCYMDEVNHNERGNEITMTKYLTDQVACPAEFETSAPSKSQVARSAINDDLADIDARR